MRARVLQPVSKLAPLTRRSPPTAGGDAGEGAQAPLLIHAILNPLSKPAQRLAPLLRFVRAAVGAEVQLLLNPEVCVAWAGQGCQGAPLTAPYLPTRLTFLEPACCSPAPPFCQPAAPSAADPALNPAPRRLQRDLDSMPLKTFYRYALPTLPSADAAPGGAAAAFTGLPGGKVLTLGMDEPEAW